MVVVIASVPPVMIASIILISIPTVIKACTGGKLQGRVKQIEGQIWSLSIFALIVGCHTRAPRRIIISSKGDI